MSDGNERAIRKVGCDVHCGVVGNIQASHVCTPGSIPGDGAFAKIFEKGDDE